MNTGFGLQHRPDIQGIRAIAIILVVLAHAKVPGFNGGFVGVDVFFVLSGYLITGILIREYEQTGSIRYTEFLSRRLRRLLPALFLVLAVTMLSAIVLLTEYELKQQTASLAYASTWTSNIFFTFSTQNYFSELQTRDLFLHSWSLGVEEQFYLFWPVLLFLVLNLSAWKVPRDGSRSRLMWALAVLFISSLALSLYWAQVQPLWSFYLMPSRIWQFALGAIAYAWTTNTDRDGVSSMLLNSVSGGGGLIGVVLVTGSAVLMHSNMTYPGYWAMFPSVGAALLLLAGSRDTVQGISKIISHPTMVWVGDRSYSLYLWHWPVLVLGFYFGGQGYPVEAAGLVSISLLLSALSYRFVELPFWKGRWSRAAPARTIAVSALLMLTVSIVAPAPLDSIYFSGDNREKEEVNQAHDDRPVIYSLGCDSWFASAKLQPCIIGPINAKRTVVLFADSIGAQWYSLLPEIFGSPEWRLIVLTKSSCPIVDEDYFYSRIGKVFSICTEWRNESMKYLSSVKPDIVFLGSDTSYGFSEKQWTEGSARMFHKLSSITKHVIAIPGTPELDFDGPSCLQRNIDRQEIGKNSGDLICGKRITDSAQANIVARYLEQAASRFRSVSILNLNDIVCPDGYCSAQTSKGITVYRDAKHLTDTFVRAQTPVVRARLRKTGIIGHGNSLE